MEGIGSQLRPEIWEKIEKCQGVLLIAPEGGFSILHTLPLYFALKKLAKTVCLCNTSLASLKNSTARVSYRDTRISQAPVLYEVSHDTEFTIGGTKVKEFFPEKYLAQWFMQEFQEDVKIYCTERTGPKNLCAAYKLLCDTYSLDLIILVDAGSDSLMAGNEHEIGGYVEDMLSIFAVSQSGVDAVLANIGLGCDRFSGISDCSHLRALAEITETGGFLGSISLQKSMQEVHLYCKATEFLSERMPRVNYAGLSIINSLNGKFGNIDIGDERKLLFVNPIMSHYFFCKLSNVVSRIKYAEFIEEANTAAELVEGIEYYRKELDIKIREEIPRTGMF